jgi:hypothetical protein
MEIYTMPNEELLPMLGKIINTLNDDRFERKQVQELLYWL